MKKSLSKPSLKNETPQTKVQLMNGDSSQYKQFTDSSLVQIGSNPNSSQKQLTHSIQYNYEQNKNNIQQKIQNVQINSDGYNKDQKHFQNSNNLTSPSNNSSDINIQNSQNINIPILTFTSANRNIVTQKQKYKGKLVNSSNEQIKKRTMSSSKLNSNQRSLQIDQYDKMGYIQSFGRIDTQSSADKKKQRQITPSPQNQQISLELQHYYNSMYHRNSAIDINQGGNTNNTEPNLYFSSNSINTEPQQAMNNQYTQIPNFEYRHSLNNFNSNNGKNSEYNNSASTKNSQASQSLERKVYQSISQNKNNISLNNNQYQSPEPILQQSISSYSSGNNREQLQNEKIQSNPDKISYECSQNDDKIKELYNENQKLKQKLNDSENIIFKNEEKSRKQIIELQKQVEELKENCESQEKENAQLCHIMSEQEQVMCRMKELYTSMENQDTNNNCYEKNYQNEYQSNNQIIQSEYNQLQLKNQEQSETIKKLQLNIMELEFKNSELKEEINNYKILNIQSEQEINKTHKNFMEQQNIIHQLTQQLQQNNSQNQNVEDKIKHSKINQHSKYQSQQIPSESQNDFTKTPSNNILKQIPDEDNLNTLSTKEGNQNIQKQKIDSDNSSLLCKIQDLECQLNQVYNGLNTSPHKQKSNIDNQTQLNQQDNKLYMNLYPFQIDFNQISNDQNIHFESMKQQYIEIENLKNQVQDQKKQIILWQERYNNLDIVHTALITEKTRTSTQPVNTDEFNNEKLKDHIQYLQKQIEDLNMLLKQQNSELTFQKINIQQKNIELQEIQIKLDSRDSNNQMIRKRLNELEEQNITLKSQKGQLQVQLKQKQDLFDNQKCELQNIYRLLKTRDLDTDIIQKEHDEYLSQTRKQEIIIKTYEKEMEELVQKNIKLQNQIYDIIHQQQKINTSNNYISLQKEMNQNILNNLTSTQFCETQTVGSTQISSTKIGVNQFGGNQTGASLFGTELKTQQQQKDYDSQTNVIQKKGYQNPVNPNIDMININSKEDILSSLSSTTPKAKNLQENLSFNNNPIDYSSAQQIFQYPQSSQSQNNFKQNHLNNQFLTYSHYN